jgi:hypothetical protein
MYIPEIKRDLNLIFPLAGFKIQLNSLIILPKKVKNEKH